MFRDQIVTSRQIAFAEKVKTALDQMIADQGEKAVTIALAQYASERADHYADRGQALNADGWNEAAAALIYINP